MEPALNIVQTIAIVLATGIAAVALRNRRNGPMRGFPSVFRFLLRVEDGEPNDPAMLVTAVPNWAVDETFLNRAQPRVAHPRNRHRHRRRARRQRINAVFTVEPV
jgi:hypothetical protein